MLHMFLASSTTPEEDQSQNEKQAENYTHTRLHEKPNGAQCLPNIVHRHSQPFAI